MPAFFLAYFLMPRKTRNYVLLLASLIFYAWGAPEFIIQLVVSTVANFFLVKWMCKTEKAGRNCSAAYPSSSPSDCYCSTNTATSRWKT